MSLRTPQCTVVLKFHVGGAVLQSYPFLFTYNDPAAQPLDVQKVWTLLNRPGSQTWGQAPGHLSMSLVTFYSEFYSVQFLVPLHWVRIPRGVSARDTLPAGWAEARGHPQGLGGPWRFLLISPYPRWNAAAHYLSSSLCSAHRMAMWLPHVASLTVSKTEQ